MSEATLIYPHQLFLDHPALQPGRPVYVIEEPLILTHNPIHRQKLLFHLETIDAYVDDLKKNGFTVERLLITDYKTSAAVLARIKKDGVSVVHIVDTTDDYLERAIKISGLTRVWYESPLFLLKKEDAMTRFVKSKKFMASFYRQLRIDFDILIEADGKPTGGTWSFDAENRKRVPKGAVLPSDIIVSEPSAADKARLDTIPAEQYGTYGRWLPTTHQDAQVYLESFLTQRFASFGDFEDAISVAHTRLWHSTLSPLINIGLLSPKQVLDTTITYAKTHHVPLNSLEGFVRQILGWREFIRASYENDGRSMRTKNFFSHHTHLPKHFWDASTGLLPFDHTITTALQTGYTHHIERLMVMGSGLLMLGIHPDEIYRWFMGMYVDAYDWVMVPNVYGMSQFADGGSFATKPYLSGASYLKKMSDYPTGDWEATWTALYWNFIHTHKTVFAKNPRMSMMPKLLERMSDETLTQHLQEVRRYKKTLIE